MASVFYSKWLPDFSDLDNRSDRAPGYCVYIREDDGGVGLEIMHPSESQTIGTGFAVFLNVDEAEEMLRGLQEAIGWARSKGGQHRPRAKNC